ncbi:MAG: hypothetical protein GX434_11065, partial [Peptococcaceae bacterium]|nr:hypothetical protein [Peptococcaceae bacterium]
AVQGGGEPVFAVGFPTVWSTGGFQGIENRFFLGLSNGTGGYQAFKDTGESTVIIFPGIVLNLRGGALCSVDVAAKAVEELKRVISVNALTITNFFDFFI